MKRFFLLFLLALLLIIVGACSNPIDKSGELSNTSREEDNNIEDKDQSHSHNTSSTEKVEKNQTSTSNESESVSKKHDDHPTTNGEEHPVKDFDMERYLNEHYPIDHTYYTTDTWENEDTGKTEYIIGIQPDTEEFGQEIDDIFKNGSPEFDDE
ncbi:hypothetical protein, partial [Bacillus sp. SD088]|uniref:hypothetical protein n=1 Tax=Bacillus sp. SD088 TaxID=2782012 RepID=UPI001A96FB37